MKSVHQEITENLTKENHAKFDYGITPQWLPTYNDYNAIHYLRMLGTAGLVSAKNLIRMHLYGNV